VISITHLSVFLLIRIYRHIILSTGSRCQGTTKEGEAVKMLR